jgi:hypothetical protein
MNCKECNHDFFNKKWGFANLCDLCDEREYESKHMAVMIADGKTDYYFQLIRNPSPLQAEKIKSIGSAHDPRSQMRFTSKGEYTNSTKCNKNK